MNSLDALMEVGINHPLPLPLFWPLFPLSFLYLQSPLPTLFLLSIFAFSSSLLFIHFPFPAPFTLLLLLPPFLMSSLFVLIFFLPHSSCIFPISPCVLLASSVYSFFLPFSTFSLSLAFTFSFYFCFPSRLSSPPSYSFPFPSLFPTFPCLLLFLLPSFFLNFPLFPPLLPPSSPFSLLPLLALSPSL